VGWKGKRTEGLAQLVLRCFVCTFHGKAFGLVSGACFLERMRRSSAPSSMKKRKAGDISEEQGMSQEASRRFNADAMQSGDVVVHRAPVLRFLAVPTSVLTKPFRAPMPEGWRMPLQERGLGKATSGRRTLGMTRKFKGIVVGSQFKPLKIGTVDEGEAGSDIPDEKDDLYKKYIQDPVVLFENPQEDHRVVVEPVLGKFLREHQREGIQFLFECVTGLRPYEGEGCILADDMGLGKTLQSITLIYTVLRQGLSKERPMAKRVIVVTPTSLVRNWDNEIEKWLNGRVRCLTLAESSRKEIEKRIRMFTTTRSYDVLIISYDTFRLNANSFTAESACDLLICDEAHRLKNDQTQTSQALDKLHTKRRVLLSGTPMQNDLEEFFAMVNFCNPGVLGTVSQFRRKYQNPILIGREPDATDKEVKLSEERSQELSDIVNNFILRRTNSLLSKHLPPKLTQVVCVYMTDMQKSMYKHMIRSKLAQLDQKSTSENMDDKKIPAQALASINALKKLCNHPQLLYQRESIYAVPGARKQKAAYGLEDINQFFPPGFGGSLGGGRRRRGDAGTGEGGYSSQHSNCEWSGKFLLCERLLRRMREETSDRMVIVSNYTQTLDLFSLMCKENDFPYVRLDGSCSAKRRQAMVDRLNDPTDDVFVFLLSSKAGGCGLNLIGANRLVLFDPDWNPATDKQAAARVWRDGQKKRTYVYRFLATGTIEEKVFQRQLSKVGLQSVVAEDQSLESTISMSDLKDLFKLRENTVSDTHDKYKCKRCDMSIEMPKFSLTAAAEAEESGKAAKLAASTSPRGGSPLNKIGLAPHQGLVRRNKRARGAASSGKGEAINAPPPCPPNAEQEGFPNEGDLLEWSHHIGSDTVDDILLRKAGCGLISFVFGQAIDGEALAKKAEADALKKKSDGSVTSSTSSNTTAGPVSDAPEDSKSQEIVDDVDSDDEEDEEEESSEESEEEII